MTDSLRVEHSRISTDMMLFSEVGLSLTQHYRVYKGGLPHAVFRTDYMDRLRSLLRSSGQSDSTPETGRASTPKSVRRLHRLSQPKRLFSEAVDDEQFLIMQNPADVVAETVIDCRPSVLPVSIPLSGLSPATISEARECVSYRPSEETGKSIMDMDTNEITINRIVGFEWDEAGTDLEDEMPTPVSSPTQIVVPVIPPAGTADPFGRGDGFDLDLAKVMCDVSVIPSLITPLEDLEVPPRSIAAEYAAPATPALETVLESPGYTVPEESKFTWIPGFVPVSEAVLEEEGGLLAVVGRAASIAGPDAGRDNDCLFGGDRAGDADGAADSGRYDECVGYGKCPKNGTGTGVRCGSARGVHLSSNVCGCTGCRAGFIKGRTL